MSFQAQLQHMVSWILHVPIENIVMTTDFKQDLKLDMYDFEMMIFQVENCFKKQFSDHEIERIQTVQDLSILIQNSNAGSNPSKNIVVERTPISFDLDS